MRISKKFAHIRGLGQSYSARKSSTVTIEQVFLFESELNELRSKFLAKEQFKTERKKQKIESRVQSNSNRSICMEPSENNLADNQPTVNFDVNEFMQTEWGRLLPESSRVDKIEDEDIQNSSLSAVIDRLFDNAPPLSPLPLSGLSIPRSNPNS
mmetsp:Transcript_40447/g.41261  ORF Transcript_40447/g.41261 Transcript_40447/m.41261 type:complete len:154 (+) Transcript_40447:273-734(+)